MSQSEYWTEFMRRRLSRRSLLKAGTVAGAGLWVGSTLGCGGGTEESKPAATNGQPKQGGSVIIRQSTDPRSLDPHYETTPAASGFFTNTNNGLVKFNEDSSKIIADLAESWEQPDDLTYVFKLIQGVKFHNVAPVNGREFVAEDVKYSIERQISDSPKMLHAYFFKGKIGKIEAVDKHTVKFVTNEPYAPFMTYMANPFTTVICREAVEKYGDLTQVAIGTGPFILKEYTRNVEAVFVRNPDYFKKGKPYLDEFRFRYIPDASTADAAFLGEETDISAIDFTEIDQVKKSKPNATYIDQVSMYPYVLRAQPDSEQKPQQPPFTEKKVRQAIRYCVDKEELIKIVRSGWGIPMVGMIPPVLKPWALPDSDQIKQDIGKAKQLLAEAGYPNGFKTELLASGIGGVSEGAEVLKDQLAKAGIDVEVKVMEDAQYRNRVYSYDYQLNYHAMLSGEEPEESLAPYLGPKATYYKWRNQEIWKKIEEQSKLVQPKDREKRIQLIHEIQRMVIDDAPITAIYVATYTVGAQPRVKGYMPAWNQYDLRREDVWVSDA